MKHSLEIEMVSCNQNCQHCYGHGQYAKYKKSLDWLKRIYNAFYQEWKDDLILDIAYLIHEITIHSQFFKILSWLNNNFKYNNVIITNGNKIANDKNFAEKLLNKGIKGGQITLYGLNEIHDNFSCKKGSFRKAIDAIDFLIKSEKFVVVNIIMHREMVKQIPEIIDFLQKHNIKKDNINWYSPAPVGNSQKNTWRIRKNDLKQYKNLLGKLNGIDNHLTEKEIVKNAFKGKYDGKKPKEENKDDNLPSPELVVTHDEKVYHFFQGYNHYSLVGDLRTECTSKIIKRFNNKQTPYFRVRDKVTVKKLAKIYGDDNSDLLYDSANNLIDFWYRKFYQENN